MIWVKVCGLRDPRAVAVATSSGADAIGLVLAPTSPRAVDIDTAAALGRLTDLEVFVVVADADPDWTLEVATTIGAAGVQPHGRNAARTANAASAAGLKVLHPIAVRGPVDLSGVPEGQIPLLDTADSHVHGGTGRRWNTSLMTPTDRRWVLAGGLTPSNVRSAVQDVRPWGVDASSGLESSPGVKDPERIRAFIEEARTA